jgi:murein DD-endopeptidase MepM/ murein hydrolase activator NlpD
MRIGERKFKMTINRSTILTLAAGLAFALAGTNAHAANVLAPPGMGNYCSVTWPSGNWSFASDPGGGDPCQYIASHNGAGGTIQRKGLYASSNRNRVVYRCYPPNYGWVGIYEGVGNGPLSAAYTAAQGKPGCIFTVSPVAFPIFISPFSLSGAYSHATGFDFAKDPYNTLNVADFGMPGSSVAKIVDFYGQDKSDKSLGYIDGHDGHDFPMDRFTPIYAVANGTVTMARFYDSGYTTSDSPLQQEIEIEHLVVGGSGYTETYATYYAHLSFMLVNAGDSVLQGQLIGFSGNSGSSSQPHLHFGVTRLSNTASMRLKTLQFLDPPKHSNGSDVAIDPYGFRAFKGFDPWSYKAYPAGALSVNLWIFGFEPWTGLW